MVTKIFSLLLLPSTLFGALVSSATAPTKCYFLDGSTGKQAGYRCNNETTGHSSCCAQGGICYSNGVCQQSNGNVQDYLRVGCTDSTWRDPACLDRCIKYANSSTAGIRFCDGSITETNQYCCDDGSQGIGSFACCDNTSNIFAIKPIATVLAQIPLVYTSTSSSKTATSTSSTSATKATTTSSATPTSTPTESAKSSSNKGTAIGAGVGVPVGVLILAGLAFLFWRHRKKSRKQQAYELENNRSGHDQYSDGNMPVEAEGSTPGAMGGKKGYFGGREYTTAPQELPQPDTIHEMGDSVRT